LHKETGRIDELLSKWAWPAFFIVFFA
jgi:hypothetical protein